MRNCVKKCCCFAGRGKFIETDEIYVGIDRHGSHHILPVQAKGGTDRLSIIQIWQDFRVAEQKFDSLTARPIATQFLNDKSIALFEFSESRNKISIARERHYSLRPFHSEVQHLSAVVP